MKCINSRKERSTMDNTNEVKGGILGVTRSVVGVIVCIVVALCICLVSTCCSSVSGAAGRGNDLTFVCSQTVSNATVYYYYTESTGVMYMGYKNGYGGSLTPIYKADGTLETYEEWVVDNEIDR